MYFRSRIMLCFDDEKKKDRNTFKGNSQSEYFILFLVLCCHVFFLLWIIFFGWYFLLSFRDICFFEKEVVESYVYRSSLTVTILCCQDFCLYYRVTQSESPLGYEYHTQKQNKKQHLHHHHVCFWYFERSCRDFFVELRIE